MSEDAKQIEIKLVEKHEPKIESVHRIEFSNFMKLTMSELGKTWDEVETALPAYIFESDYNMAADGIGTSEGEVFVPLCNLIKGCGLDHIILYHDR